MNGNTKKASVAEKIVYLRHANKFYSTLKDIAKKCVDEPNTYSLAIGLMQNLPLPNTPVQEIFYYHQIWINYFSINDSMAIVYLYHEGISKKGRMRYPLFCKFY